VTQPQSNTKLLSKLSKKSSASASGVDNDEEFRSRKFHNTLRPSRRRHRLIITTSMCNPPSTTTAPLSSRSSNDAETETAPRPGDAAAATTTTTVRRCRVVIAGAGPAGLLLQALLHLRNQKSSSSSTTTRHVLYEITLVESRQDLGQLSLDVLQSQHRSWMIGLAGHGLEAVRSVPGLYDNYLANIGVKLTEGALYIGKKKITMGSGVPEGAEGFIVDRNFIVAALARFAKDNLEKSEYYTPKYETELLYVDHEKHRILLRDKATQVESYMSYDLLVGADGIRSTVREALVKKHFDFELQVGDIFSVFKAVHIERPESLSPSSISFLPSCMPYFNGICLPETNGLINLSVGVPRNAFDSISDELKSNDPTVVAQYLKKNFTPFQLSDEAYLDWATQWTNQRWNRTGQVHCNRYSSVECKIVMMGDSVHATSPSIGMGMNTALRDAQKFIELLDIHDDDLTKVLPQYSIDRVPEGNALTHLALNLYCFDMKVQMQSVVKGIVRSGLNYLFPSYVNPDPNAIIGLPHVSLSEVYHMAMEQGVIAKHRMINLRIRQEHFEKEVGMVKDKQKESSSGSLLTLLSKTSMVMVPAAACALAMMLVKSS
jgi:kynurenine 3-monooxygenase